MFRSSLKYPLIVGCLALIVGLVTIFIRPQTADIFVIDSTIGQAQISLSPETNSLPPTSTINLAVVTSKPLAFSQIEFTFDQAKIELAEEIELTHPTLKKLTPPEATTGNFNVSTKAQANAGGRITMILAVEPSGFSAAPSGTINLANLKFKAKTTGQNQNTSLTVDLSKTQLVDTSAVIFASTADNASFVLNPSPSASTTTKNPADLVDTGDTATDQVNIHDYTNLVSNFGKTGANGFIPADIVQSGIVDIHDYTKLVSEFGK